MGSVIEVSSILAHAANKKDKVKSELSSHTLGRIIKAVFGDQVKEARRGPRGSQFKSVRKSK